MLPAELLNRMVNRIHSIEQLRGCVIGLYGDRQCQVLHPGYSATPDSGRIAVIIEECILDDPAILEENRQWAARPAGSPEDVPSPAIATNRSKLGPELLGAGLSCGLTVVSAVGVLGGAAAEIPSAGTSTFLVIVAWTGLVTQGIQCVNGLVRVGAIAFDPEDNTLQRWDENDTYTNSILIVDAIGVVSTLAALPAATRNLFAIIARQRSFASRGLTLEILKRMNRAERARVIREIMDEASKTPAGRKALMEAAKEAQIGARSLERASSLSVRHANGMVRIVGEETIRRLRYSLLEVVVGGVGSVVASGTPARLTGSASGSVNWIINVIDTQAQVPRAETLPRTQPGTRTGL